MPCPRRTLGSADESVSDSGIMPFPRGTRLDETYRASLDPGPQRTGIARLLDSQIEQMERRELMAVIRATDGEIGPQRGAAELEHQSLEQLRRMAYLSRRCCRNQVNAYCSWRGLPLRYKAAI